MNIRARALLVALAVSSVLCPARAADSGGTAMLSRVVYAVSINGVRVSDGALLLSSPARGLYARADDLRAWRIVVPPGVNGVVRDAVRYVALGAIPGLSFTFDPPTQTLLLRAGPTALAATAIRLNDAAPAAVEPPAGAYANYVVTQSGGSYGAAVAAEVQTGVAAWGGIVKDDVAWSPGLVSRLQTAWEHDDPNRMRVTVVGDATTTDTTLGSALRFAGVQWASDFSEQPQYLTYPGVTIRGAASVPSALDIYVNDVLTLRREVPAGPYTLGDLGLFDGAGTIAVRAADALGGTTGFDVPYYVAPTLLKPGLASYSYSAGFLDENATYGPFFVDAARRWGLSDTLPAGSWRASAPAMRSRASAPIGARAGPVWSASPPPRAMAPPRAERSGTSATTTPGGAWRSAATSGWRARITARSTGRRWRSGAKSTSTPRFT